MSREAERKQDWHNGRIGKKKKRTMLKRRTKSGKGKTKELKEIIEA